MKSRFLAPAVLVLAAFLFAALLLRPLWTLDPAASDSSLLEPPPPWILPLDDAYIFIRYAQQAARGRPFEWTDGETSTGASSFLYPFLLVPGQWLFDDLAGWSRWSVLVGFLGLCLLGLVGRRLLRAAGLEEPWPLVGGLALIGCGPLAWSALAGMDSALGSAALLFAVALWMEAAVPATGSRNQPPISKHATRNALVALALLPLLRPDFAVVVGAATLLLLTRRGLAAPRWTGVAILLPGLALMALHLALTGHASPGGALAKSSLVLPFPTVEQTVFVIWTFFSRALVPLYLGAEGLTLPPPVGWLAVVGAVLAFGPRSRWARLRPLAGAWLLLVLSAPLSGYLTWQHYRHHHPGIACAWLLATFTVATAIEGWTHLDRSRARWLLVALPGILWMQTPFWSFDYFREAVRFHQANGMAAEWLTARRTATPDAPDVLLLHDAGLLALAHDGPMVDIMGLGTTRFAVPYRHDLGAVVEELGRIRPRPTLAAVWSRLFAVPGLLGPALVETRARGDLAEDHRLKIHPFLHQRLNGTDLDAALLAAGRAGAVGIDFADLDSEARARLRWSPRPPPQQPSAAFVLRGRGGRATAQGCRPLPGTLRVDLPRDVVVRGGGWTVRLRAVAQPGHAGHLRLGRGVAAREFEIPRGARVWSEFEKALSEDERTDAVLIENLGPGMPCLESIAFLPTSTRAAPGS